MVDPGEEPLGNRSSWEDDEADLIGDFRDNSGSNPGSRPDAVLVLGAVGEELFDEGKDGPRRRKHRPAGVAVLHKRLWYKIREGDVS